MAACGVGAARAVDPNRGLSQYVNETWGVERGFPNETVSSIAQTSDGYLWIGTDKGLIRFDGLSFERHAQASPQGVSIAGVQSLVADGEGNLWVLLPTTKLLRYHDGSFEVARGEAENGITAIGSDSDHRLLLTSLAVGTLRYNGTDFLNLSSPGHPADAQTFQRIVHSSQWSSLAWSTGLKPHRLAGPSSWVMAVASSSDGGLWLGTEDGGLFLQKAGQTAMLGTVEGAKILSILPGDGAGAWIGTSKGLLRWDGTQLSRTGVPAALQREDVLSLMRDKDANVWIGTSRQLLRMNQVSGHLQVSAMPTAFGAVHALFEDRESGLWLGGDRGLQRLRDSRFVSYPLDGADTRSPRLQGTGAVYADADGRVWTAPIPGGLRWLQDGKQGATTVAGLSEDVVYSIAGGERGELWLGRQRGGLTRLQYAGGRLETKTYTRADGLAQNSVYAVYRSRNGTLWAGTLSGGVSELREGRFTTYTTANGLASNTVSSIAEGMDGTMWFGTPNGLSELADGRWRTFSVRDGHGSSDIDSLLMDASGTLWIGTAEGLAFLHAGRIETPSHLPDSLREPVFGMAEDSRGRLWISTANHILQVTLNPTAEGSPGVSDVREYGFSDGLQSKEGVKRFRSVIADAKGRVWFSTSRGLSVVSLPRHADSEPPVLVHIVGVSADGKPLDLRRPLRVPPAQSSLTFRFAGLSLNRSERVRYRYRLDELEHGWSEVTSNREATYGNLRPGTYRFHVIACNSDGIWSAQEASIALVVQPTLLQNWWFRLSLLLCAGVMTIGLYQLRVLQLTRLLNLRFEERLAERTRIAQELHDTLLQSFQGLILRFQAANEVVLSNPHEAKEALEGALDRADQAMTEGRKAIQGIRSDAFSDHHIERALRALMNEMASDPHITRGRRMATSIIVEGQPQRVHPWVCEELCRIAQEALRNAFAHSQAEQLEMEIAFSRDYLRVRVRDDGVGIVPGVLKNGARAGHWGLTGMRERAESLRGHLSVWSRPNAGTEVEVTIPAAAAYEPGAQRIAMDEEGGSIHT